MKKLVIILSVLLVLSFIAIQLQQHVSAVTVGIEPPASYMNSLKSCTPGTFKDKKEAMVAEYKIKGLLPNGRCEVTITTGADLSNPEDLERAKEMMGGFVGMFESMAKESGQSIDKSQLPSVDEMLKMAEKEKTIEHCKLSKNEREALYAAWQKHDGKNPPPQKTANGGYAFSFDSSKMSSYDSLMMRMAQGPCESYNSGEKPSSKTKKYACEYADTTCYWIDMGNGASSMQCSKENPNISTFKLMDKVKEHVKSGMCEQI